MSKKMIVAVVIILLIILIIFSTFYLFDANPDYSETNEENSYAELIPDEYFLNETEEINIGEII